MEEFYTKPKVNLTSEEGKLWKGWRDIYRKYPFFIKTLLWIIGLAMGIPLFVFIDYCFGEAGHYFIKTDLSVGEALGFWGAFLSAIGTVALGIVTVWQTHRANVMTEKMMALENTHQIAVILPQDKIVLKIYKETVVDNHTGIKCGAELKIGHENGTELPIVDFSVLFPEIYFMADAKQVQEKGVPSVVSFKAGCLLSSQHILIQKESKAVTLIKIPSENIAQYKELDKIKLFLKYKIESKNIYGYTTEAEIALESVLRKQGPGIYEGSTDINAYKMLNLQEASLNQ